MKTQFIAASIIAAGALIASSAFANGGDAAAIQGDTLVSQQAPESAQSAQPAKANASAQSSGVAKQSGSPSTSRFPGDDFFIYSPN